jgi:hypothetical protein
MNMNAPLVTPLRQGNVTLPRKFVYEVPTVHSTDL